ncbi:hypothetical protein PPTG_03331 [Phytophthora nicotianae INRA-310]|uniref:Uncharacterized protein n=1 Tax=Phytophthora nicotianae (strain INRA-310) TaxID=761204 RepID=W2R4I3_PHYN3|nr:hypothetical protein PPTG_03331 [Phytophthora nicotianae INRA-310]ETN20297.1 hypothetical protein PPTG_03331 [Phytophthora nicotianae INRA-310]
MTAKRTKAPYESAPKKTCKKCDRKISWHKAARDAQQDPEEDMGKNRAKRVGFQRDQRAAKFFEELQDIRAQLREAEGAPALPQPKPKGMSGHPLEVLSFHPGLFEHAFVKAEKHELLSKKGFHALLLFLHSDKSHHLPQEWQNAQNYTAEDMEEASTRTVYEERVRIETYRLYLQTKFKQRFNNWEAKFIYYARFLEKDKAYEIKEKAKLEQAATDIRFLETFGAESESDEE